MKFSEMTADKVFEACDRADKARASAMPTEKEALSQMLEAYLRLKELGWNDVIYCPKDGQMFDSIEVGSTGIATTKYEEGKFRGRFWAYEANDIWPSHPILFKLKENEDGNS